MSQTRTWTVLMVALVVLAPAAWATCTNGTSGNDNITGTGGDDCILTFGGDDVVNAQGGADTIEGGNDDDDLYGDAGADYIDTGLGSGGVDRGYGGTENDTILTHDASSVWSYAYGQDGNDELQGDSGWQNLFGGNGTGDYADGSSDYDWCKNSETQVNCECEEIFFENC